LVLPRFREKNLVNVAPQDTAAHLGRLINSLCAADAPKVLFGFSQDGFLMPYLAQTTKNVQGVVGVGCGYHPEAFDGLNHLRIEAIHGQKDERVAVEQVKSDLQALRQLGFLVNFHHVVEMAYKIEPHHRTLLFERIRCAFLEERS